MKALSIRQPWAYLIVTGHKDVENRTWKTSLKGRIAIHAGKNFDREGYEWVKSSFPFIPLPLPEEFERGGIIGEATITGCVDALDSPWFFGPHGFTVENGKVVDFIPCKGKLGFFEVGL